MQRMSRRGQSVTEYVIVISVVAAAVIGMQLFVKRGLQGKQRDVTDYFTAVTGNVSGSKAGIGTLAQYEPYYTAVGTYSTVVNNNATKGGAKAREQMSAGGKIARTKIDETTTRTGSSTQGVDFRDDNDWTPP